MIITEIQAEGFRNLAGRLTCSAGINILCGDNAQGKTNWLEAIYLLGNTKSFRTTALRETLRFGSESTRQALIRGNIKREGLHKELQIALEENSKVFYTNGKRETVSRYIGNLDVLIFSAEEMQIVRGEPSERRRFLDRGVVGLSPAYLKTISEYNRVLKQKNILLKEAQESDRRLKYIDLIESWNEQLIEYGTQIYKSRFDYTEKLRQVLGRQLFSEKPIDIRYCSSLDQHGLSNQGSAADYRQLLQQRLRVRLENEIASGYALVGPHRDELEILIDGLEASKFGSSGEQRSALITLDLAQISVYNLAFEEYPVFLIDDIDAELDARRISLLLEHIEGKMQVFISTSKRAIAARYSNKAVCHYIQKGRTVPALLSPTLPQQEMDNDLVDAVPISTLTEHPFYADSAPAETVAEPITEPVFVEAIVMESISIETATAAPTIAYLTEYQYHPKASAVEYQHEDFNELPSVTPSEHVITEMAITAPEIIEAETTQQSSLTITSEECGDNSDDKHRAPF